MRPPLFIHHLQLVITTGGKQTAYRYMHQILFLFLGKLCLEIAHFLYADQEKNRFHIRFFSEPGHQLFFQRPPPALDIIFHVHPAKITRLGIYRPHLLPLRKFSVMLQLAVIRQQPEFIKKRLLVKNFDASAAIDKILELDEQRKRLQLEIESEQAGLNLISKEIGQLMAKGEKTKSEERKQQVVSIKSRLSPLQAEMENADAQLQQVLITLPNLPAPDVPEGKTPEDNVIVREGGLKPQLPANALAHWDLAKKYNLIDFELGNKITGSGFPVYINTGAKLQRALIQYFLDYNTAAGFVEYQPPLVVNETSAFGTGQLPDKEGQMYYVPEDKLYLIPTSEVPLTNILRDTIVKEKELPVKMTAYTPCFRREAGSYGKDVRGLNRLHQFDKVEIVQIVHPGKSYAALEEMILHVEKLLLSLDLPYRILRLCGGDMSFTSAITYDFEVYSAAQQKWLEVSSVSNFESFQTNRMKIRFKDEQGKMQLLHSLNGSSLALPRILACLLENHQGENFISLPAALHPYFKAERLTLSA
jgi:seryl-tRNA synthetase